MLRKSSPEKHGNGYHGDWPTNQTPSPAESPCWGNHHLKNMATVTMVEQLKPSPVGSPFGENHPLKNMTTVTMVTGQQLKHHLQQSLHVGEITP